MKALFYVLASLAGLFGLLSLFRTFEHLLTGDGFQPIQFVIGVVGISLAWLWIKKARSAR